ncbi:MAG: hypothetical protein RQM92_18010 [Candidatus Syntrophopropionicum ammoniitolerans]
MQASFEKLVYVGVAQTKERGHSPVCGRALVLGYVPGVTRTEEWGHIFVWGLAL